MQSALGSIMDGAEKSSPTSIQESDLKACKPRIVVVGIGGGGNNTIDRIKSMGVQEVEMVAINTDQAHLSRIKTDKKIPIGQDITQGRGTGGHPKVGRRAAMNSAEMFREAFEDTDLVFIASGLGGGTGTGAAPVAARVAKEEGATVTGVVTMPFEVENRTRTAEEGLNELREHADSVIVIENDRLSDMASGLPMGLAFTIADEVLSRMLKGITETIMVPSLMNLDFADVKAIMKKNNVMLVGAGEADGANRAEESVWQALDCPLLGEIDYSTANGVIMHVSGADVTVSEVDRIGEIVKNQVNDETQIIPGARVDRSLGDTLQTILLISGASSSAVLGHSQNGSDYGGEPSCKSAEAPLDLNIGYI